MKVRIVSALMLLITLLSCDKKESVPSFSYLALGDSYTIGQSVEEEDRWPVQLAATLSDRGTNMRPPIIVARTGWTTSALMSAIERDDNLGAQYDMVSLLIGVNNQFGGGAVETFGIEFELLLQKSIALAGDRPERVFVLSIPDYGVTAFGQSWGARVSEDLIKFNAVIKTVCEEYNVTLFDITPLSQQIVSNPEYLASDRLHYSGEMYRLWVDLIADDVEILLRR